MFDADYFERSWKPKLPYATNSFVEEGLHRTSREIALTKRFIETSPKRHQNFIPFDFDFQDPEHTLNSLILDDGVFPMYNYLTINLATGNGQGLLAIKGHVQTDKAIDYLKDITKKLTIISGGDMAYGGRTMRNPLHDYQRTIWGTDKLYTLEELNGYASKLKTYDVPIDKEREVGVGRNEAMFEALRKWAYRERLKYDTYYEWCMAAEERANELNFSLDRPLPASEVKTIVNSTVKWVWKNFSKETFSRIQSSRSRRRGVVKNAPIRDKAILDMVNAGFSSIEISENLGISYGAARTAIHTAKKRYPNGIDTPKTP